MYFFFTKENEINILISKSIFLLSKIIHCSKVQPRIFIHFSYEFLLHKNYRKYIIMGFMPINVDSDKCIPGQGIKRLAFVLKMEKGKERSIQILNLLRRPTKTNTAP